MKFRFCGDLDCPDWILAEISLLSKLTSIKMKLLCSQVVKDILGEKIDYDKLMKLTADAKYEESDVKSSVAALEFIFSSAAKHTVDGESLDNELQQLGLPKENASSLCKVYSDSITSLQHVFAEQSLRVSTLESVDWRVDYVLSSSALQDIGEPVIQLKMSRKDPITKEATPITFSLTEQKFRLLFKDLKQAHSMMESLG